MVWNSFGGTRIASICQCHVYALNSYAKHSSAGELDKKLSRQIVTRHKFEAKDDNKSVLFI